MRKLIRIRQVLASPLASLFMFLLPRKLVLALLLHAKCVSQCCSSSQIKTHFGFERKRKFAFAEGRNKHLNSTVHAVCRSNFNFNREFISWMVYSAPERPKKRHREFRAQRICSRLVVAENIAAQKPSRRILISSRGGNISRAQKPRRKVSALFSGINS